MTKSKSTALGKGYAALVGGISEVLESGRNQAAWTLNSIISAAYWEVGRRIVEFEQAGQARADYGERVIEQLSIDLRKRYGRGFGRSLLFQIRAFHLAYRDKIQTVSGQSKHQKVQTVSGQLAADRFAMLRQAFPLSWSQYVRLLTVENSAAREFYESEALRGGWSVRQLDRLAAMLLPALFKGKAQAQSIVCKNHLHEMGIALRMYVDEYKAYPSTTYHFPTRDGEGELDWPEALAPYYQLNWTNPAYHCPAYSGLVTWLPEIYGSYSYNTWGGQWPPTPPNFLGLGPLNTAGHSESQVVAPSELFAIMDTPEVIPYIAATNDLGGMYGTHSIWMGKGWSGPAGTGCAFKLNTLALGGTAGDIFEWQEITTPNPIQHDNSQNVLFGDGHVLAERASDLTDPTKTAVYWNIDHKPHEDFWQNIEDEGGVFP